MTIKAVVGTQWGDEGKGRMVDLLAQDADAVVRFQGGGNAGHTIYNEHGKFIFNLLPSGAVSPKTKNILGAGVVVDLETIIDEYEKLDARLESHGELFISDRAHVVLPVHKKIEAALDQRDGITKFGSTRRGIAQAYQFKVAKFGLQIADLCASGGHLRERLTTIVEFANIFLDGLNESRESVDALLGYLIPLIEKISPFVCDTNKLLDKILLTNGNVLLEGQLGALRDLDWGIYPFTTSSNPLAGFASVGAGVAPGQIDSVLGVVKAYSSCVGEGPFVVEMSEEEASVLREVGREFGATTNRPRRVGWFDAVATRYGVRMQGADNICVTLLDVLSSFTNFQACYAYDIDGEIERYFPTNPRLTRAKPVFKEFTGWEKDIRGCRKLSALPPEARTYLDWIERELEVPISHISVGPNRDEIIVLN